MSSFNSNTMMPQYEYAMQRVHNRSQLDIHSLMKFVFTEFVRVWHSLGAAVLFVPSTFCSTFLNYRVGQIKRGQCTFFHYCRPKARYR